MRPLLLFCLILACTALPVVLRAKPAFALQKTTKCQCMEQKLDRRWADSQAVFTGTVTDIEPVRQWTQRGNNDIPVIVTITVDEGFKAVEKGNIFKFHSNQHHDTCMGADFEKGTQFLFFGYERRERVFEKWSLYDFDTGTFDTGGLCGGTKRMDDALSAPEIEKIKALPPADVQLYKPNKDGFIGMPPEKGAAQPPKEE